MQGNDTVIALCKKIALLIDEQTDTREERIRFEPRKNPLPGSLWKSAAPRDRAKRIDLVRSIATKLREGNTSFVVFHIDGDRPWAEAKDSENVAKFQLFREEIRRLLPPGGDHELRRLLLFAPFYSIEAWLYQHVDRARALCEQYHRGEHLVAIEAWRGARGGLDELWKPKERHCLRGDHNLALAGPGFPAREILAVDKSFAATVRRWQLVGEFAAALALTSAVPSVVGNK